MYTVVSLFCGAGGLDYGFHKAGFKVIWATDKDKDSCKTFEKWSKIKVVNADINKLDISTIPESDIILGGFPCQGFSLAGPRNELDKRNSLYKKYVEVVKEKQPKMFIGENVKGILSLGGGKIFEQIVAEFKSVGYDIYTHKVNAKDYNVPQDRERIIIIGVRKDLGITPSFPAPSNKIITLKEALKGVKYSNDEVCKDSYTSRFMSRNRKRTWEDVSYTIPAQAKQVPLHPSSPDMKKLDKDLWEFGVGNTRRFSWRESAAIQTFPKSFVFEGDLHSKYRQIGNAVPVNLAYAIAKEIKKSLDKIERDDD